MSAGSASDALDGVSMQRDASANPMIRQTTRTIKRSEEIQEITVEFRRLYRNQRLYNYNDAIARRAEAGGDAELPWQTRAFIRTYERFKFMSADPNEVRAAPQGRVAPVGLTARPGRACRCRRACRTSASRC